MAIAGATADHGASLPPQPRLVRSVDQHHVDGWHVAEPWDPVVGEGAIGDDAIGEVDSSKSAPPERHDHGSLDLADRPSGIDHGPALVRGDQADDARFPLDIADPGHGGHPSVLLEPSATPLARAGVRKPTEAVGRHREGPRPVARRPGCAGGIQRVQAELARQLVDLRLAGEVVGGGRQCPVGGLQQGTDRRPVLDPLDSPPGTGSRSPPGPS